MQGTGRTRRLAMAAIAAIAAIVAIVATVATVSLACAHAAIADESGVLGDAAPARARPAAAIENCPHAYLQPLAEADRAAAIAAVFERSEAQIKAGDFAAASAGFDCVDALAAGSTDWRIGYELTRRRGVLAYYQERIVDALALFNRALELASSHGDSLAEAKSWKNVGSALRRLGDFKQALQALLTSLDLYRRTGTDAVGPVLNNIADVYRDLHDSAQAMKYYDEALAAYRRQGDAQEAAHTLESMSVVALDAGDAARAQGWLREAMTIYEEAHAQPHRLRVYAGLARAAIARGEVHEAADLADRGLALARELGIAAPPALTLQSATALRLRGEPAEARERLRAALAQLPATDAERPALLEALADADEASGDLPRALASLREFHAADLDRRKHEYDSELGWLRTRFETAERDRTIAALAAENDLRALTIRQRTSGLWLMALASLTALLALALIFHRRQQRARLAEAAQAARLAEEIEQHRRAAAELVFDRRLLQATLDSRDDAVLVLDPTATVVAANQGACRLLGRSRDEVVGHAFGEHVGADAAAIVAAACERFEDASAEERFRVTVPGMSVPLAAQIAPADRDAGLAILGLYATDVAEVPPPLTVDPPEAEADLRSGFRRALVELMLVVVEAWERSTGLGRLELAEKSRIWRITIDDGRLRVRAMDRYLSLAKLPRLPRWRDVLRSGYFVLAECRLDEPQRSELQRRVDAVLAYTRRRALV